MKFTSESEARKSPSMLEDYKKWRAMGEGGTAPNWAGYLSCISAEKTMAFEDTISPDMYKKPEKYATGWSKATPGQKAAAQRSFLTEPLPQREGPRSRAKRYVYPQREKNATEYQDPEIKKVSHILITTLVQYAKESSKGVEYCIQRARHSKRFVHGMENVCARETWHSLVSETFDAAIAHSFSKPEGDLPHTYLRYVRACYVVICRCGGGDTQRLG